MLLFTLVLTVVACGGGETTTGETTTSSVLDDVTTTLQDTDETTAPINTNDTSTSAPITFPNPTVTDGPEEDWGPMIPMNPVN